VTVRALGSDAEQSARYRPQCLRMDATGIRWLLTGHLIFFAVLFWVVKTAVREGMREDEKDRKSRTTDAR